MDVDTLRRGQDFRDALDEYLAQCSVMISLIGPFWLDCKTSDGRRRLDDPRDLVRREIAAALKRKIPLIPILLDHEQIPNVSRLPLDIQLMSYRQAAIVRGDTFDRDMAIIERDIKNITNWGKRDSIGLVSAARRVLNLFRIPMRNDSGGPR